MGGESCSLLTLPKGPTLRLIKVTTHDDRVFLYDLMTLGGRHTQMLYDDASLETWLTLTCPTTSWTYAVAFDDAVGALFVLNGFSGKTAFVHFCIMQGFETYTLDLCSYALAWMFESFTAILGATPAVYRHVLRVIRQLGFEKQCVVPDGHWIAAHHTYSASVVTIATKGSFTKARGSFTRSKGSFSEFKSI